MDDLTELLQPLGFSDYEARAYLTLLQQSPLNGYELAKLSGVPRANVYAVLDRLTTRGAIVRLDTPEGARYAPVAPAELLRRLDSHFQQTLHTAQAALEAVVRPPVYEAIGNIRGYSGVLDHARGLLGAAHDQVLIALWPAEAEVLAGDLAQAQDRGVAVTTLCLAVCPHDCGNCRGAVYRYQLAPEQAARWLVCVVDGAEVLAGEIGTGGGALALRTRQRLLVQLVSHYMRDSIALAALLTDLGPRLMNLLRDDTRAILATLGPGGAQGGWLAYLQTLLHRPSPVLDTGQRMEERT
jgi:predicted transcriptional regulator